MTPSRRKTQQARHSLANAIPCDQEQDSYVAATSGEKAKALRLEAAGRVRIVRELDTRILRVAGKPRLVAREIFNVEKVTT